MSYLIGLFLAASILIISVWQTSDNTGVYMSILSLMIVLGGTLASGIITFSFKEMFKIVIIFKISFRKIKHSQILESVEEIIEISRGGTNPQVLQKQIKTVKNHFLKDALQMIIDGIPREKIAEILHTRIEEKIEKEKSEANVVRTLSKYPSAFGMMGTIIGLVALLQGINDASNAANIGSNMAIALITTLYGIVISYFFLVPIADNLENRTYHTVQIQKMVLNGYRFITR